MDACRRTGSPTSSCCARASKFHNGDPVTAEDVKFSFERYRGAARQAAQGAGGARSRSSIPRRVRFRLKEPWPDFMTFYGTAATGRRLDRAQEVRREGRRRRLQEGARSAPGPYKFVSLHAGRRAGAGGLRAATGARRPSVKRLVFKVDPRRDHAAGRAQARRGRHRLLDPRRARPRSCSARPGSRSSRPSSSGAVLARTSPTSGTRSRRGTTGACAWPPASPSTAQAINQAETLGLLAGSPAASSRSSFEFYWQPPAARLRSGAGQAAPRRGRLSRTASTPATSTATPPYATIGEAVVNYLQAVGHPHAGCGRWSARPSSRRYQEKKLKNLIHGVQRRLRQRGHPARGLRGHGRHLRLRRLSRHRRALPASRPASSTARSARRCCTRSSSSSTSKAMYAPIWRAGLHQRRRARASRSPGSASSPATRTRRPTRT